MKARTASAAAVTSLLGCAAAASGGAAPTGSAEQGCPERAVFASTEPENRAPAWSPDGRSIAFDSTRTGRREIYVLDVAACVARQVTSTGGHSPDWSPDGRRLVFVRDQVDGGSALWIVGADGAGLRSLTRGRRAFDMHPSWSPRGDRIAFDRDWGEEQEDHRDVYTIRADGTGLRRLTKGGWNLTPAWSPRATTIAWGRSWRGNEQIWIMRADGKRKRRVTPGFANGDADPTFSPDARRIAYMGSTATIGATIWIKTTRGGRPRHLVRANSGDPDWSPDGRWIAFELIRGKATDLYLVRPDGTGLRPIAVAPTTR